MPANPGRQAALGFIFVTLVLTVLGFGILIPVLPGLVTQFEGGSVSEGSHSYGWIVMVFSVMQFFAAPVLGALSDRFGRRRVLLIALAGSAIDYVIMGWAPSLGWLFVGRMISGLTAGTLSTVNAYVADVTPPERRAQAYGMLGAAFGLGFVIGPALGGLLGGINLRLPFYVAAGCVALNWFYGLLVLPESLDPAHRRPFSWRRANPIGSMLAARRFPAVMGLLGSYFLFTLAQTMLQVTWVLYTGYRYHWTTKQVGWSLMFLGIVSAVVQSTLVRPIIARIGERRGLVFGMTVAICGHIAYGLAPSGWMIYAIGAATAVAGVAGPSIQAFITRHVPANEQGSVQGVLSGLMSLGNICAPIGAWSFAAGIAADHSWHLPGIAFFEAALATALGLALAIRAFRADDRAARENANQPAAAAAGALAR
jgi:MFS transporter, DHA1 family, tetracycline resistance protein